MTTAIDAARAYLELGWAPVPVLPWNWAPGHEYEGKGTPGKTPGFGGLPSPRWQTLRLTSAELPGLFAADANVGVILGPASGELVDVDLDSQEAVDLAPLLLPATWIFGRAGRPRSHWLYVAPGVKTEQFRTPDRAPLLELRGAGAQTVLPGSVHHSGERIEWSESCDAFDAPTVIDAEPLRARAAKLAAASLALRHAGRDAVLEWISGADCPQLPPEGAALIRRWWGVGTLHTRARPAAASTTSSSTDAVERARRYVAKMDPAIAGAGGHAQTFLVAQRLRRSFALDDATTLELLREYNARCAPPWSERELRHKVDQARERGTLPFAELLGEAQRG